MTSNVSAWAIRKPVPSLVLFLVVMILGLVAFKDLPVTRFPNIDIPIVSVTVTQSGAAPVEIESQVAKKIEDSVAGVTGVKHTITTITEGRAMTLVEFELNTPVDRAINDVKDAVAQVRADLPSSIDEPIIQRLDIVGLPIVTYAARAPALTAEELSWFVDDTIARELQSVKGVASVARVGGVTREIRVALSPDKLIALGITAGDVNRQLRSTNVNLTGGRSDLAGRQQAIRTLGNAETVQTASSKTDRNTWRASRQVGPDRHHHRYGGRAKGIRHLQWTTGGRIFCQSRQRRFRRRGGPARCGESCATASQAYGH